MSDAALMSLFALIGTVVTAVISLINNFISRHNSREIQVGNNDIAKAKEAIVVLEKNTNSIKDALVASTAKASKAEGKVEGIAEQKAEQALTK